MKLQIVSSCQSCQTGGVSSGYPHQPSESCGLAIVVSFFCIGSLRAMSAQVTWGTWFGLVIGILSFCVLLGFGSTLDGPDLELVMGDPNTTTIPKKTENNTEDSELQQI